MTTMQLDHMILPVNDVGASVEFYADVIGLTLDGENPPFTVMRVTDDFTLQLAPFETTGGVHLEFAMARVEFDAVFDRIKARGIAYGDRFHSVGNMKGPGEEPGARGNGKAVYCFDPSLHLIEIRHYE